MTEGTRSVEDGANWFTVQLNNIHNQCGIGKIRFSILVSPSLYIACFPGFCIIYLTSGKVKLWKVMK